jgi:2-haloacid dehalogenase
MLRTVVQSNGLESYLDQVVTVEDVKLFKTAPQSYQLLIDAFSVQKQDVLFVSSNAWDAVGASWFGYDVFWVNRSNLPFEEIGPLPTYQGNSLSALLELLNSNNS